MDVNKEMIKKPAAELITEDGMVIELVDVDSRKSRVDRLSRIYQLLNEAEQKEE